MQTLDTFELDAVTVFINEPFAALRDFDSETYLHLVCIVNRIILKGTSSLT